MWLDYSIFFAEDEKTLCSNWVSFVFLSFLKQFINIKLYLLMLSWKNVTKLHSDRVCVRFPKRFKYEMFLKTP